MAFTASDLVLLLEWVTSSFSQDADRVPLPDPLDDDRAVGQLLVCALVLLGALGLRVVVSLCYGVLERLYGDGRWVEALVGQPCSGRRGW
eukprot:201389-Pyramimonas_sp.AAC.1